jgi:hypothetical protein
MERRANDKLSSLLRTFINYGRKKFYKIGPSHLTKNLEGNTQGGSITVLLTSCLTGLD